MLFLVFCGAGYIISWRLGHPRLYHGVIVGALCALFVMGMEWMLVKFTVREIMASAVGLATGLLIANLSAYFLTKLPFLSQPMVQVFVFVFANLTVGYLGLILVLRKRRELPVLEQFLRPGTKKTALTEKILDTSVIIDGRIADVVGTGFVEGILTVPRFVLEELQHIADSPDALKRARGRRGLDVLSKLQKLEGLTVKMDDTDIPEIEEVDSKMVKLAKMRGAKIVTNDYNLNKVADLHGVLVLNINDLANSLKPVFLPGEELSVRLVKKGKEVGQGVGFLDDGTMVVVDEGATKIGRTVTCLVTSMLQTTAGRMIFSALRRE